MTSFAQAQAEGVCLRYPENLGIHPDLTVETAINMLLRGIQLAANTPFVWQYIDKPTEGQTFLLILPPTSSFPVDGIRYQEPEKRALMSFGQRVRHVSFLQFNPVTSQQELELHEIRYGFIPGSGDSSAWRLRRRYRLLKGGFPQLVLVHYSRGPQTQIIPSLMNQPVRNYPLRQPNEPALYVMGEKAGQKVFPPGMAPSHSQGMAPGMGGGMAMGMQGGMNIPGMGMPINQQAMLAQQNSSMEMLERRRERDREAARRNAAARSRLEDDDSADENDQISARTLALTRYRRNHDLMNEVFHYAAYGDKKASPPPHPLFIFNKAELEQKVEKLQDEIQRLKAAGAERKARLKSERESMQFNTADMLTDSIA